MGSVPDLATVLGTWLWVPEPSVLVTLTVTDAAPLLESEWLFDAEPFVIDIRQDLRARRSYATSRKEPAEPVERVAEIVAEGRLVYHDRRPARAPVSHAPDDAPPRCPTPLMESDPAMPAHRLILPLALALILPPQPVGAQDAATDSGMATTPERVRPRASLGAHR